tara:strand:+ start:204 stop:527 length:324 start_codon:yes stop_codon:yes gene_type:complete
VSFPHSFTLKRNFYEEVRMYDASLEPWLRSEYKNIFEAEKAFNDYKIAKQKTKPSLLKRLIDALNFSSFTMGNITNKSIEEYLSQARDHYDLEQRERKLMNGHVRFA